MHTPTILLIAAAASAAVAAPVTTVKPTNPINPDKINYNAPVAAALASAGMVDTEGHCMHPPRDHAGFAALDTAAVHAARASIGFLPVTPAAAYADEGEEETQEQYNKKLVKMDKAREHGVVCTVL